MVYFADFETTTNLSNYYKQTHDTRVWLWFIKSIEDTQEQIGVDLQDFIKYVCSLNNGDTIYFHNLSFDGDFIVKYLANNGWHIENGEIGLSKTFKIFRNKGKIYYIYLCINNKVIHFQCTYLLLSSSIKALGKSLSITKLEDDVNKDEFYAQDYKPLKEVESKYIDYIKRDVEIAKLSYINFNNVINNLSFVKNKIDLTEHLTVTSLIKNLTKQSVEVFNKLHSLKTYPMIYFKNNQQSYLLGDELLYGGLTQFNLKYANTKSYTKNNLFIDVNSAYPNVMSKELPYGDVDTKPHKNFKNLKFYHLNIKRCQIKPQYSNLAFYPNLTKQTFNEKIFNPITKRINTIKRPYRYLQEVGAHQAYWWSGEWETLLKFYDIDYEVIQTYYVKSCKWLQGFIDELYEYKKQYKREGKNAFCQAIKIVLNSTYGSLCMQGKYPSYLYFNQEPDKDIVIEDKILHLNHKCTDFEIGQYQCYEYFGDEEKYANRIAASYITSYQRSKLMNKMLSCENPNENFMYCDTDSILFGNLSDKDFKKLSTFEVSEKLGDWGKEQVCQKELEVNIFGAKKYMLKSVEDNKILKEKFAGINTTFDWDKVGENEVYIEDANMITKRVKSGILLVKINKKFSKGHH